jgi:hypothetical protein
VSAYIVDHDHIDGLLSYAIAAQVRYVANGSAVDIELHNATEIGRILIDENERSVRHRYPGCDASELPGTDGQDSANYKFRRWRMCGDALVILKACDGFEYQACETDNYEQSLAATIIRTIRNYAIRRLPGYDKSPGWSLSRPVKA